MNLFESDIIKIIAQRILPIQLLRMQRAFGCSDRRAMLLLLISCLFALTQLDIYVYMYQNTRYNRLYWRLFLDDAFGATFQMCPKYQIFSYLLLPNKASQTRIGAKKTHRNV